MKPDRKRQDGFIVRSTDFRLNFTHLSETAAQTRQLPQTHKDVLQVIGKKNAKNSTASCCAIFAKNVLQRESGETKQKRMITISSFLFPGNEANHQI